MHARHIPYALLPCHRYFYHKTKNSPANANRSCNPWLMSRMASNLRPTFAYVVVYVKDVEKSVAFYANAFGYNVRRLDHSHRWGELESGQTTIAFTPLHQKETDQISGAVQTPASEKERSPMEVCFVYEDVDAAYKGAVENGAAPVSPPEMKEWGQKVGYVRDVDGNVVRMGSYVKPPSSSAA